MVEHFIKFPVTSNTFRMSKYGKIIRIRWCFTSTAAPTTGQYFNVYLTKITYNEPLFYINEVVWIGAAGVINHNQWATMDVNIDVDKDDQWTFTSDVTGAQCWLWYDIVDAKSSKNRQFVDNLSGLHSSPGGYTT